MKQRVVAIVLVLCLALLFAAPGADAAGDIYFAAVNNTVKPLSSGTMPVMIGGLLYIPCGFFSSEELGVSFVASDNQVLLYHGQEQLRFDTARGTVVDQDKIEYGISAEKKNGLIYVPVNLVCRFFGINYETIPADPAPVVRFYVGVYINQKTFLSLNKSDMEKYYDAYVGKDSSPGASSTSPTEPAHKIVTLFLSFNGLSSADFKKVLDKFDQYRYKCCFFVSADEIASNAELLRRAAGTGYTIGLWLKDGTPDEYEKASSLLFEATKLRSILVSAGGEAAKTAEATAGSEGLVFWEPTKSYNDSDKVTKGTVTGLLNALDSSRVSINMACTDGNVSLLSFLLDYLAQNNYIVKRITETTAPTYSIS